MEPKKQTTGDFGSGQSNADNDLLSTETKSPRLEHADEDADVENLNDAGEEEGDEEELEDGDELTEDEETNKEDEDIEEGDDDRK